MCTACGTYRNREIIDVMTKILKREEKRREHHEAKTGKPEKE